MTPQDKHTLTVKKNETLTEYLEFCIGLNEVPRKEIVILINNCTNLSSLISSIDIFLQRKSY